MIHSDLLTLSEKNTGFYKCYLAKISAGKLYRFLVTVPFHIFLWATQTNNVE